MTDKRNVTKNELFTKVGIKGTALSMQIKRGVLPNVGRNGLFDLQDPRMQRYLELMEKQKDLSRKIMPLYDSPIIIKTQGLENTEGTSEGPNFTQESSGATDGNKTKQKVDIALQEVKLKKENELVFKYQMENAKTLGFLVPSEIQANIIRILTNSIIGRLKADIENLIDDIVAVNNGDSTLRSECIKKAYGFINTSGEQGMEIAKKETKRLIEELIPSAN